MEISYKKSLETMLDNNIQNKPFEIFTNHE
jgi:hypothetical protein